MIRQEYFDWLVGLVTSNRQANFISFSRLLTYLHEIEFRWIIPRDQNRAINGQELRWRYAIELEEDRDYADYILNELDGPCSVLEMMVALALHCEEDIMDDPAYGNRAGQWFWNMIVNLGLGSMTDDIFDQRLVDRVINRFLNRDYDPDGKGGLFRIRNCDYDLRDVEIEYQLYWYLNSIT
jgi:hypothetical protein